MDVCQEYRILSVYGIFHFWSVYSYRCIPVCVMSLSLLLLLPLFVVTLYSSRIVIYHYHYYEFRLFYKGRLWETQEKKMLVKKNSRETERQTETERKRPRRAEKGRGGETEERTKIILLFFLHFSLFFFLGVRLSWILQ